MSLDDLPTSERPPTAEPVVQRVDRAGPNPYKVTRAEELRLQLADEIVRGALPPGAALDGAAPTPKRGPRGENLRLHRADEIGRGAPPPGAALDETDIARRFKVSRTP